MRRFVTAKTRVVPLAATSILRFGIDGSSSRIQFSNFKNLKCQLESGHFLVGQRKCGMVDKRRSRSFKSFVGNHVGEIQTGTDPRQWRFFPINKNPADSFARLELLEQANNEK